MANNKLQLKRYVGSESSGEDYKNYVLSLGEPFFDYKRKLMFVGDGTTSIYGLSPFGATDGATIIDNINKTPDEITDKIYSDRVQIHSGEELIESINSDNSAAKISSSHLDIPEQQDISGNDIVTKINSDETTTKISSNKVDVAHDGNSIISEINKDSTTYQIRAERVAGGGGGGTQTGEQIIDAINEDTSQKVISSGHIQIEHQDGNAILDKLNALTPSVSGKIKSDLLEDKRIVEDETVDDSTIAFSIGNYGYSKRLTLQVSGTVDSAKYAEKVTKSIAGTDITNIFEDDIKTVKEATNATNLKANGTIAGKKTSEIFDTDTGYARNAIKANSAESAQSAESANNATTATKVVNQIGEQKITDIFVTESTTSSLITTTVKKAAVADKVTGSIGDVKIENILEGDGLHAKTADKLNTKGQTIGNTQTPVYINSDGYPTPCQLLIPTNLDLSTIKNKAIFNFVVGKSYDFDETGYSTIYDEINPVLSGKSDGQYSLSIKNSSGTNINAIANVVTTKYGKRYVLSFFDVYSNIPCNYIIELYSSYSGNIIRNITTDCYVSENLSILSGSSQIAQSSKTDLYRHNIQIDIYQGTSSVKIFTLYIELINKNPNKIDIEKPVSEFVSFMSSIGYHQYSKILCYGEYFGQISNTYSVTMLELKGGLLSPLCYFSNRSINTTNLWTDSSTAKFKVTDSTVIKL